MDEPRREFLRFWYVAFVDYGVNIWWHRFLRPGFRHCFAFTYDPDGGVWLKFEVGFEGIDVRALSRQEWHGLLQEAAAANGRFLKVERRKVLRRRPAFFVSCVTAVKWLVGGGACALSPWQLYRSLLREGAQPAFESLGNELSGTE